jgi:uncharacterized protein (TIGR00266 family)
MVRKTPLKDGAEHNIPNYEIGGTHGNAFLKFYLNKDDVVIADGGSMCYMDGSISLTLKKPKKGGGIFGKIMKSLSGESFFSSYFVGGEDAKGAVLALSTPLPGDIIALPIKAGETWTLSAGSFLAASSNIKVSGSLKFKGIFSWGNDEGMFRTTVTAAETNGVVFVESYGHIEKHVLKTGQTLKVDNEGFLACIKGTDYTLAKAGKSIIGSWFSSEGLVMSFKGPCILYTQSKGVKQLADVLGNAIGNKQGRNSSMFNTAMNVID